MDTKPMLEKQKCEFELEKKKKKKNESQPTDPFFPVMLQ